MFFFLRWDENSANAARSDDRGETGTDESISYSDPKKGDDVIFTILPNMNRMTGTFGLKRFVDSLSIDRFDAFLIFTADEFTKKLLICAKKISSSNKPLFLIRAKIDKSDGTKKEKEESNEEMLRRKLKEGLEENSKDAKFDCCKHEIYLISNPYPDKWDFLNLVKNIAHALPSPQKESFSKTSMMKNLDAWETFQNFLRGTT